MNTSQFVFPFSCQVGEFSMGLDRTYEYDGISLL